MAADRLKVVVSRRLPASVEARMQELFDVTLRAPDIAMTRADLAAALQSADVLVTTLADKIDAELIDGAGASL